MTSQTIGRIDEYYEWQDWNVYYERLEQFFTVNDIPEEKRVGVLISVIGTYSYKILRDLCHPVLPKDKSFDELCELMRRNCCPQVSIFRERIKFYRAAQEPRENVTNWYRRMKSNSVDCKFGGNLEAVLLDKFVTGLRPGPILDRLCEEKETLTLSEALSIAVNKEAALENGGIAPREPICEPCDPCEGRDEVDFVPPIQICPSKPIEEQKQKGYDEADRFSDSGHGTVIECDLMRVPPNLDEKRVCFKPPQPPVQHTEPQPAEPEVVRKMFENIKCQGSEILSCAVVNNAQQDRSGVSFNDQTAVECAPMMSFGAAPKISAPAPEFARREVPKMKQMAMTECLEMDAAPALGGAALGLARPSTEAGPSVTVQKKQRKRGSRGQKRNRNNVQN